MNKVHNWIETSKGCDCDDSEIIKGRNSNSATCVWMDVEELTSFESELPFTKNRPPVSCYYLLTCSAYSKRERSTNDPTLHRPPVAPFATQQICYIKLSIHSKYLLLV